VNLQSTTSEIFGNSPQTSCHTLPNVENNPGPEKETRIGNFIEELLLEVLNGNLSLKIDSTKSNSTN
jgi:hypothetical protein